VRKVGNSMKRVLCGPAGVASKDSSSALSLDRGESLKLLGLHGHLATEANLASSALDERDTVRVQ